MMTIISGLYEMLDHGDMESAPIFVLIVAIFSRIGYR